jgi:hypothetical protein
MRKRTIFLIILVAVGCHSDRDKAIKRGKAIKPELESLRNCGQINSGIRPIAGTPVSSLADPGWLPRVGVRFRVVA